MGSWWPSLRCGGSWRGFGAEDLRGATARRLYRMGGRVPVGWQRLGELFIAPHSAGRHRRAAARRNMLPTGLRVSRIKLPPRADEARYSGR
jgi:hypothetical protein